VLKLSPPCGTLLWPLPSLSVCKQVQYLSLFGKLTQEFLLDQVRVEHHAHHCTIAYHTTPSSHVIACAVP
jgi:hypothetical protein